MNLPDFLLGKRAPLPPAMFFFFFFLSGLLWLFKVSLQFHTN